MIVAWLTGKEQFKVEAKLAIMNGSSTQTAQKTHIHLVDSFKLSLSRNVMETTSIHLASLFHAKTMAPMVSLLSRRKCLMEKVHGLHFGFYQETHELNMGDGLHAVKQMFTKAFRVVKKFMVLYISAVQGVIIKLLQIIEKATMILRIGILIQLIGSQIIFAGMLMLKLSMVRLIKARFIALRAQNGFHKIHPDEDSQEMLHSIRNLQ